MGIGWWELVLLLAVVVMVFGTKRLRNMGGDLGEALKGFRAAMRESDDHDKKKADADKDPRLVGEQPRQQASGDDHGARNSEDARHKS